jgi:hypothetical protein
MPTRRTPIARRQTVPVSERAIALYWKMIRVRCTCLPYKSYWTRKNCPQCEGWWSMHSQLHDELGCRLWEWPAICPPCRYLNSVGEMERRQPTQRMIETARRIREAARANQ